MSKPFWLCLWLLVSCTINATTVGAASPGTLSIRRANISTWQWSQWKRRESAVRRRRNNQMPKKPSRFDQLIDRVFDTADVNKDGRVSFDECYILVMKLYIYINRQAPVPPPTRQALRRLFETYDTNRSHSMSRAEFTALSQRLGQRAFLRLLTGKLVRIVGAPLLTELTMRSFRDATWPHQLARAVLPKPLHPKLLPLVTSPAFCRTCLIVTFVSTLGNIVVGGVNYALHKTLPGEEEDDY